VSIDTSRGIAGLKGALRYVRAYRDQVFVVKLGGEVLGEPEVLDNVTGQLALLSSLSIRLVVVHGGGPQATALSRRLGVEPTMVAGRRVTDAAALEVAKLVYAGQLNVDLLAALRAHRVQAVGLSGVDADLITAHRRPPVQVVDDAGKTAKVDYGHVGDVDRVDSRVLATLVEARFVPVVASLAGGDDGEVFNVNADTVAESLAVARAEGADLPDAVADELVAEFAGYPEDLGSSILFDHEAGRPLEWDARNGVVARLGARHGVPTPVSDVIVPLLAAASG